MSQDSSGANATNTFLSGKGDVLLTYESEAINANLQGKNIQYVIPRQTMLIQLPIAVLKGSKNKDTANKFIRYLKSTAGAGAVRPVRVPPGQPDRGEGAFSRRSSRRGPASFTIDDKYIGGWRDADKTGSTPSNGLMVKIEQAVGGPTG